MHTNKTLSLCLLLATALAAPVSAAQLYSEASVGYLIDTQEPMGSARFGAALVKSEAQSHNIEFEVAYTSDSEGGGKLKLIPLMVNYRLLLPSADKVEVYVGGGVGSTNVRVAGGFSTQTDMVFTYQVFAGCGYRVSEKLSLTLGARFIDIGKMDYFSSEVDIGNDTEVAAGVRFTF